MIKSKVKNSGINQIIKAADADIVKQFSRLKGIKGRHNRTKNYFKISDTTWEVVGCGHWGINSRHNILVLSGESLKWNRKTLYEKKSRGLTSRCWPKPPINMTTPIVVMYRQPYHLAVYATDGLRNDVSDICRALGWWVQ